MRTLFAAVSLLALTGCKTPDASVSYRIARVNGQSLPFTLREGEGECPHWLLEGFINMPGDKTYTSTYNIDIVCPDKEPTNVTDPGIAGTIRTSNDTIYFINSAGEIAGHGVLDADSLVVQGPKHKLTYMRVPDNEK